MNLLVDFITVRVKSGAGEYLRRVFHEILEQAKGNSSIHIYALWDSHRGIAYEDLQPDILREKYAVTPLDCAEKDLPTLVRENGIDRFYIACGQYIGDYPSVADLTCEVICAILDCYAEDLIANHIWDYWAVAHGTYDFKCRFKSRFLNWVRYIRLRYHLLKRFAYADRKTNEAHLNKLHPIIVLLENNSHAHLIVISDYTRRAIQFHFSEHLNTNQAIDVLWPPSRVLVKEDEIMDKTLRDLVSRKVRFLLMVSANRESKNPVKLQRAYARFQAYDHSMPLVMVGHKGPVGENVIALPFLSDADLDAAFRNCYALVYPSYFEGFGYPPVEAMRYGKPVLSSNTTSIPEVLGDSAIYFSPFYETDIFKALMTLAESDYAALSERARNRYVEINERQEHDLKQLVQMILTSEHIHL